MGVFDSLVPTGESIEQPPLVLELGSELEYLDGDELHEHVARLRGDVAQSLGFRVPKLIVRISAVLAPGDCYQLLLRGEVAADGRLPPGKLIAIGEPDVLTGLPGETFTEPVYGLPAKAIDPADTTSRALAIGSKGCTLVTTLMALQAHLKEVFNRRPHDLLSWGDVVYGFERQGELDEDVIEIIGAQDFRQVFETHRALLREGVSIIDRRTIIEAIASAPGKSNVQQLTRIVRRHLGAEIVGQHLDRDGRLPAVRLDAADAAAFRAALVNVDDGRTGLSIEGKELRAILERILSAWSQAAEAGRGSAALVVDGDLRGPLASVFERVGVLLKVIGTDEIPPGVETFDASTVSSPD